jgi:hypothetical protein
MKNGEQGRKNGEQGMMNREEGRMNYVTFNLPLSTISLLPFR